MVVKNKKTENKPIFVITSVYSYGPFSTKTSAESHRAMAAKLPGTTVSVIKKTARGYFYTSKMQIGARNAVEKTKAVSMVKKYAPSSKVTISKRG